MSCQSRLLAANLHWCNGQFASCCQCIISCRHVTSNVVAHNDIKPIVRWVSHVLVSNIEVMHQFAQTTSSFRKCIVFMHLNILPKHRLLLPTEHALCRPHNPFCTREHILCKCTKFVPPKQLREKKRSVIWHRTCCRKDWQHAASDRSVESLLS